VGVRTILPPLLNSDDLVHRTLLTYLATRAGKFPRGSLDDTDLGALKRFVRQHPDVGARRGITEDEMCVLLKAVEGVQDG
jgi:hypothetical protein